MATNYSGNDQSRESRTRTGRTQGENREKNYSGERKNYNRDNRNGEKSGEKKEFQPRNNNYRNNGNHAGGANGSYHGNRQEDGYKRDNNRGNGEYKPRADRGSGQFRGGNGRAFDKGFDKDSDEEKVVRRKPVQRDSKPKEGQTEKIEIMNRLEKEKKAMKKKASSKKEGKPSKHQTRPKRIGNIDWTSVYENDEYDDDDLDMYY